MMWQEEYDLFCAALLNDRNIEAIRIYRAVTGESLVQAKNTVDKIVGRNGAMTDADWKRLHELFLKAPQQT